CRCCSTATPTPNETSPRHQQTAPKKRERSREESPARLSGALTATPPSARRVHSRWPRRCGAPPKIERASRVAEQLRVHGKKGIGVDSATGERVRPRPCSSPEKVMCWA